MGHREVAVQKLFPFNIKRDSEGFYIFLGVFCVCVWKRRGGGFSLCYCVGKNLPLAPRNVADLVEEKGQCSLLPGWRNNVIQSTILGEPLRDSMFFSGNVGL